MTGIFQKMFGRQPQQPQQPQQPPAEEKASMDSTIPDLATINPFKAEPPKGKGIWQIGYSQSVGRQRDHNEDSFFVLDTNLSEQGLAYNFGIFVVADGMGGHINGERASGITVRTIAREASQTIFPRLFSEPAVPSVEQLKNQLNDVVQQANQAVKDEVPGGGTTLTALMIIDQQMVIAHVGDSRAYSFTTDGGLQPLTRDHSFVQQLVEMGQLTPEEASKHPQRNVLSMALGQLDPLTPDLVHLPLPASGLLLICSDGLWGVVPAQIISQILIENTDPQQACIKLIEAANLAGGPDNITAVLIKLPI